MPSVEKKIKDQYARVFSQADWTLYKEVAETYLQMAAHLKMRDVRHTSNEKLIRNIQKRLHIGLACEFLLKAFYLKSGYCINQPKKNINSDADIPYKFTDIPGNGLDPYRTYTLNHLIQQLRKVHEFEKHKEVLRGFRIAKVFRNKEGHVITSSHVYEPDDYSDIESALVEFYREGFSQKLTLQFSVGWGEQAKFDIGPLA